jgi:hypothetical protein
MGMSITFDLNESIASRNSFLSEELGKYDFTGSLIGIGVL